jgi:hypothetical protein
LVAERLREEREREKERETERQKEKNRGREGERGDDELAGGQIPTIVPRDDDEMQCGWGVKF